MVRHVVDVNLFGAWLGMHLAAPRLRAAGNGVIVNISSTAGLIGYSGIAGYVASKWGLRGLTKAAATELGTAGVRVCSVHPGPIATFSTGSEFVIDGGAIAGMALIGPSTTTRTCS
jgi:3alpha(or 20beta)-hydroxysteroid dehydrogenase